MRLIVFILQDEYEKDNEVTNLKYLLNCKVGGIRDIVHIPGLESTLVCLCFLCYYFLFVESDTVADVS